MSWWADTCCLRRSVSVCSSEICTNVLAVNAPAKNRAIDAIRFLAALLVILGHIRISMFEDYPSAPQNPVSQLLYAVTSLGSQAVLVFFALSGYWVGGMAVLGRLRRDRFDVADYAIARLSRLWLVLIPALALTLIADTTGRHVLSGSEVYAHPERYVGIDPDPSHSPLTLLGNVFFVQYIHVQPFGFNLPLWSLAYEFWYYAIFPAVVIAVSARFAANWRVVAALVAIAGCLVAGLDVLQLGVAWLFGVLAAMLAGRGIAWAKNSSALVVGGARLGAAGLLLVAMIGSREGDISPAMTAWVVGAPAALLLWTLAADLNWTGAGGRVLDFLEYLSRSSYSLYAIHMPLVVLLAAWLTPARDDRWALLGPGMVALFGIVALMVVLAIAFASQTEARTGAVRRRIRPARERGDRGAVTGGAP